ncbi:hypothetical protein J6590_007618 [Homalodisca vitripennis]|nr:hypothetical protein J6590_007618 [Homalodisca vitripennis]
MINKQSLDIKHYVFYIVKLLLYKVYPPIQPTSPALSDEPIRAPYLFQDYTSLVLRSKSSNDESDVKCTGSCGYVFHGDCIRDDKKTRSTKDFKCKECRASSSQSSAKSTASCELSKDFLLKDVGAAIGVEVLVGGISAAHRVPSFSKDRDTALVVHFVNRTKKEEWITKYRMKKPPLTAQQVNQRFPSQRVYIKDHLSPENKQLLSKLKQKCREIGYTYAWCRDAKFFCQESSRRTC